MRWNRIFSLLLMPLMLQAFAGTGSFCVSRQAAYGDVPEACGCTVQDNASERQGGCCDQEDSSCRCAMHAAGAVVPLPAAPLRWSLDSLPAAVVCVMVLQHLNPPEDGRCVILREAPPSFATVQWPTVRMTC